MLGCWDYKICCEPDRCMCWQWSALYPALLWAASTLCWLRWLGVRKFRYSDFAADVTDIV